MAVGARRGGRGPARSSDGVFLVKPYVQLGDAPRASATERVEVLWQAPDRDTSWTVEARAGGAPWAEAGPPSSRRYAPAGIEPRRLVRATISGLEPGAEFAYRVLRGGVPVFEARAGPALGRAARIVSSRSATAASRAPRRGPSPGGRCSNGPTS